MADSTVLVGRWVSARLVADQDVMAEAYTLAIGPDLLHSWRLGGASLSPGAFKDMLEATRSTCFIVESRRSRTPIGLVELYNSEFGVAWISAGVTSRPRMAIHVEALVLVLEYAFDQAGFRKIYAQIPVFNDHVLGSMIERFMEVEGILRGDSYHDGQYHDCRIASINPITFRKARQELRL